MAYGQTGSGKTHTMLGKHKDELLDISVEPVSSEGIIPRAIREILRYEKLSSRNKFHKITRISLFLWLESNLFRIFCFGCSGHNFEFV